MSRGPCSRSLSFRRPEWRSVINPDFSNFRDVAPLSFGVLIYLEALGGLPARSRILDL